MVIIAYLITCLPLYAEVGASAIYGEFNYKTIDKIDEMDINTILEDIDLFVKEYTADGWKIKSTYPDKKGRYIENFKWEYYFVKEYLLEHDIWVDIELFYNKKIFISQKQLDVNISIIFSNITPLDIDISKWPDYTGIARNFVSKFYDFMFDKNIKLKEYYIWF